MIDKWLRSAGEIRLRRLPVAGRLALVFCGLAGFSMAFALILQTRALDRDLQRAARARLDRSARAADQLLRGHLHSVAERYAAISRTPEFRANLEIDHFQTLVFFADQLRRDHRAALVAFQDAASRVVASSGSKALVRAVPAALRGLGDSEAAACVEIDRPAASPSSYALTRGYRTCRHPRGDVEAAPIWVEGSPYAVVAIALQTGVRRVGSLLVAEALDGDLLETWSALCGADVRLARQAPQPAADLVEAAKHFPGGALWISSSLQTERLAVSRSRRALIASSLLALAAAFGASLGLARSLARPLRAMQEATEEIRRGDLAIRLESARNDEFGDLSRAFNSMLDRLDESQKRLRRVQQLARFGEWSLDFDTGALDGSPEFRRALGIPGMPTTGLSLGDLLACIHPEDRSALRREIERCREVEATFQLQVRSPRDAENAVLLFRGRSRSGNGGLLLEGSVQDLTEKLRVEEQIRYLSYHDTVTGLGNARFFRERLLQACRHGRREGFAVMLVGLDQFQIVNETHGHSFGDAVLRATASRLLDACSPQRQESGESTAIARLGGDEFALLFERVSSVEEAAVVAKMLLERLSRPHAIHGEEIVVSACIGVCFGASPEADAEALLRDCDSALHQAKDAGRNRIEFFDELVREETSRRLRIDGLLRRALQEDRLELHFQPRIAAASGSIVCFEALLRWTDGQLGPVSPSDFIPIAEDSGLIQTLGSWVMTEALEHLRSWTEAGYDRAKISINVSPHRLHGETDREIEALLQGLDPQRIELEVTESALLRDEEAAIEALRRLRRAGFRISLDDFGTGYSSLSYLRKLPIDAIKIDRSFIRSMERDRDAVALIGAIIAMARTLRLGVVAEGVETADQSEMLIEMGCDELQGFFYGAAVRGEEALRLLAGARDKKRRTRLHRPRSTRRH